MSILAIISIYIFRKSLEKLRKENYELRKELVPFIQIYNSYLELRNVT